MNSHTPWCAPAQDRLTLGALITLDVHARDVVQQLVDADVAHTTDFEWASQLRYYWRDNVWVEMVQACIAYGYEYLGNTPRCAPLPLPDAATTRNFFTVKQRGMQMRKMNCWHAAQTSTPDFAQVLDLREGCLSEAIPWSQVQRCRVAMPVMTWCSSSIATQQHCLLLMPARTLTTMVYSRKHAP